MLRGQTSSTKYSPTWEKTSAKEAKEQVENGRRPSSANRMMSNYKPMNSVTLQDIQQARERISNSVKKTPLIPLNVELEGQNKKIFLKLENLHPLGSFKIRGACNAVCSIPHKLLENGVYTASTGNFAQTSKRQSPASEIMNACFPDEDDENRDADNNQKIERKERVEGEHNQLIEESFTQDEPSVFHGNALYYITGFIVRKVTNGLTSNTCSEAIIVPMITLEHPLMLDLSLGRTEQVVL
ncbi:L-threonine dehydratase catabolic tdcb-like [Plakobranchus ocellatus]|uniref:L-serine deaminase n=1 Tax=Plakobranchus ocellatus TaxID=259542 RepID=A0AAV3Z3A0_9GAST|nr:L-threonine dehydratase catabolic tdcb-like [Plakobranchus ocellatus]